MEKINLGPKMFIYPMPVVLVGATVHGKDNFMTAAWVTRVSMDPPLAAVAINRAHYTAGGIIENETFSLNFPSAEMVAEADYCGLVSGRKTDKARLFKVFYGMLETAPMIEECPLCMECRLVNVVELPKNHLFIGEIVAGYSEDRFLTDGVPDPKKMNPIALTMPDNHYWTLGEPVGQAWSIGKKLKETEKP
jgi:flavin reductase (DIM6/NTAB) family NADH-FMN oxidoreductase RutF